VGAPLKSLAVYQNKLFATDSTGNTVYTSTDGLSWSSKHIDDAPPDGASPGPMAVFNGLLFVTNSNQDLFYTGDGNSWSWIGSFGPLTSMTPFGTELSLADSVDDSFLNLVSPSYWWFSNNPGALSALATFN